MSELIALGFDSEAEAEAFRDRLAEMERASVLQLRDAAEVLLGETGRPRIRHANDLVGPGALGGVFWVVSSRWSSFSRGWARSSPRASR